MAGYDAEAFYVEVVIRADSPDGLPESRAEMERDMAEWCKETWGRSPGKTWLKIRLRPIYDHPGKHKY